ncbi:MAG: gamma-glutamyl-phosphate reductase, partial [Alphaproteobacteria bacterium]
MDDARPARASDEEIGERVRAIAAQARRASSELREATEAAKRTALRHAADHLRGHQDAVLAANERDLAAARNA